MTLQSILLSIALQSSSTDYLLLFLFLIVAIIFFAIFYSWWRDVSDEDLEKIKEADANQTSGPATVGEEMLVEEEEVEGETAVSQPTEDPAHESESVEA